MGLPSSEDRIQAAGSLLKQSPDAKSGTPTRQLKRAYAAMLNAIKENHLAEKEHLIQATLPFTLMLSSRSYEVMAISMHQPDSAAIALL